MKIIFLPNENAKLYEGKGKGGYQESCIGKVIIQIEKKKSKVKKKKVLLVRLIGKYEK